MPSTHAYPLLNQRSRDLLNQLHRTDWSKVKTLTIQNCDPTACPFKLCPMHSDSGSSNPLPVLDQVVESGPGVLVLDCRQNIFIATALARFAGKLTGQKPIRRSKSHGKAKRV